MAVIYVFKNYKRIGRFESDCATCLAGIHFKSEYDEEEYGELVVELGAGRHETLYELSGGKYAIVQTSIDPTRAMYFCQRAELVDKSIAQKHLLDRGLPIPKEWEAELGIVDLTPQSPDAKRRLDEMCRDIEENWDEWQEIYAYENALNELQDAESGPERTDQQAHNELPERADEGDSAGRSRSGPPQCRDGFDSSDRFWFRGREIKFGRASKRKKLVKSLWNKEEGCPSNPRELQTVIDEVYGEGHDTEEQTFRQLCYDTNTSIFQAQSLPLTVKNECGMVMMRVDPI